VVCPPGVVLGASELCRTIVRGTLEEETAAKRALSFETAMFLSKERIYEQYLCAITSTEYCGPDARGEGSAQQSRIEHIIYIVYKKHSLKYGVLNWLCPY
jgi:hypothetical protein